MQADTTCTYYTEDTPAILSHAGSNSDLSILSIPNDVKPKKDLDLSDDSSNLSGDNENILAECIQSAMPKPRKANEKSRQIPILSRGSSSNTTRPLGNMEIQVNAGAKSRLPDDVPKYISQYSGRFQGVSR